MQDTTARLALSSFVLVTSLFWLTGCGESETAANGAPDLSTPEGVGSYVQKSHGLEHWWQTEALRADIVVKLPGNPLEATFVFETNAPRARMDVPGGPSVIYDGKDAYITPADAEFPMARFHVLTWPWFLMAPLKAQGDGIRLSDVDRQTLRGTEYVTVKQTFGEDVGDAPEDWYRLFVNPETGVLEAMSYIVSYGKSAEQANEQPSIILYGDYEDVSGVPLSKEWTFYYFDEEAASLQGEEPKITASVSNLEFVEAKEETFAVPEDARLLPLPE